jgi:DNA replication protein DnaC
VRDLAGGAFLAQQRNAVLVGGTGTGKTHLAIAIARSCIRAGARGRFYNVVDLVNRLEIETRNGRQGRLAEHLTRMDFIVLDELGYLPFAQSVANFCSTSSADFTNAPRLSSRPTWHSVNGRARTLTSNTRSRKRVPQQS